MVFKDQLNSFMAIRRLSGAELSRLSGVSQSVISDWRAGVPPKNIIQVKKVADVFGVTIDELCFGSSQAGPTLHCRGNRDEMKKDFICGIFNMRVQLLEKNRSQWSKTSDDKL